MSSDSISTQINDLKTSAWSHRFGVAHNFLVDEKLNSELRTLINTKTLRYGTLTEGFGRKLKSKKYCAYQSDLLLSYLLSPEEHLTLDCDRLVITMTEHCTDKVIDIFENKAKIKKTSIKGISKFLSIEQCSVGQINGGKKGPKRPFYSSAYRFTLYNDRRRFFILHVANGDHHKNKLLGLRVDFIPNRFTEQEIRIFFGHLRSVLTHTRYNDIIGKAKITRVDIGFNMPGLLSSFVYFGHLNRHRPKIECLPAELSNSLVETTYRGNRFKSNHYILYEKLLKEFATEVKEERADEASLDKLLQTLAVTTRFEMRYFSSRSKAISLSNLSDVEMDLSAFNFADPKFLYTLGRKQISSMLRNKDPKQTIDIIKAQHKNKPKKRIGKLSLDGEWYKQKKTTMLKHYQQLIESPERVTSAEVKVIVKAFAAVIPDEVIVVKKPKKVFKALKAIKLSTEQQQAIESRSKFTLVQAGAGTGKTRTIIERVKYMLDIRMVKAPNIAVFTFTKNAAQEIKTRLKTEGDNVGKVTISTFNSWCFQSLKSFSSNKYKGYTSSSPEVFTSTIGDLAQKFDIKGKSKNKLKQIQDVLSYRVNKMVKLREAYDEVNKDSKITYEQIKSVWQGYKKYKKENRLLDYDDQLEFFYHELGKNSKFLEEVKSTYRHIIMDEMQDSNIIQWHILMKLTKAGSSLFCVGDPAQGIYSFRGADTKYLDDFSKIFKGADVKFLVDNYRSTPELLAVTNTVRKEINTEYKKLIEHIPSGQKPCFSEFVNLGTVAKHIAQVIKVKLNGGRKLTEIRVLAKTNAQVKELIRLIDASYAALIQTDKDDAHYKPGVLNSLVQTMHSSKGMEFDICFVVDPRIEGTKAKEYLDSKDEHLKIHYVALTRAKQELYLCKSMSGDACFRGDTEGELHILDIICSNSELVDYHPIEEST